MRALVVAAALAGAGTASACDSISTWKGFEMEHKEERPRSRRARMQVSRCLSKYGAAKQGGELQLESLHNSGLLLQQQPIIAKSFIFLSC